MDKHSISVNNGARDEMFVWWQEDNEYSGVAFVEISDIVATG